MTHKHGQRGQSQADGAGRDTDPGSRGRSENTGQGAADRDGAVHDLPVSAYRTGQLVWGDDGLAQGEERTLALPSPTPETSSTAPTATASAVPDSGRPATASGTKHDLSEAESTDLRRLASTEPQSQISAEHRRFLQLRETAYAAVVNSSDKAADRLTNTYRDALKHAHLQHNRPSWTSSEYSLALRTPHDRVLRQVVALLTSPDLGQLHQCEDVACGWVYLDTSPRRNRRWCSTADCGNRNRARRYYARRRDRP